MELVKEGESDSWERVVGLKGKEKKRITVAKMVYGG